MNRISGFPWAYYKTVVVMLFPGLQIKAVQLFLPRMAAQQSMKHQKVRKMPKVQKLLPSSLFVSLFWTRKSGWSAWEAQVSKAVLDFSGMVQGQGRQQKRSRTACILCRAMMANTDKYSVQMWNNENHLPCWKLWLKAWPLKGCAQRGQKGSKDQ